MNATALIGPITATAWLTSASLNDTIRKPDCDLYHIPHFSISLKVTNDC